MRRSPAPDFKVGDKVFVKAQFFQTIQPSKKLSEKYLGPYEIIAQPSTLSFTLCLPESMCSVHPVFHVWLGYKDTGDKSKWISTSELTHAVDLVSDFHITYPTKSGPLPLFWSRCCICSLFSYFSNRDYFPSLISSILCLLILINPQLPHTFWGFLFKLQTSFHFNSCLFLLTHLIHRKK